MTLSLELRAQGAMSSLRLLMMSDLRSSEITLKIL